MNNQPQYLVGIDLGTTHTVVAYSEVAPKNAQISIFEIAQLVAPGEVAAKPLLPSVRYHPAEGELAEADFNFVRSDEQVVIGTAARLLGAKSQGRLVTSAKSWLSHPSVDHSAAILPWGSDVDVLKVSPLHASASYLRHIRNVWRHQFSDAPLEQQDIVITVPASFDEAARALTLQAAHQAGLPRVRLLEEPQAVCYDWLHRHADNMKQVLQNARLILICDVGGGTTDLTLIKIDHSQKEPELTRIGVGDHLMLGGDNVDLALAHVCEARLSAASSKLSPADFSQLIEQCRIAKERLLAPDSPEQVKVTLLGGGSRLIGGSRSTHLTRAEVLGLALDGFFPLSDFSELPSRKRSGVVEFGLPYAAEPAISKHIAAFLHNHSHSAKAALASDSIIPDALLLNGGVFRSQAVTQRLIDLLTQWGRRPPLVLNNVYPELAVAYGAVAYAQALRHQKTRIGGGAARSYFLLIDSESQQQQGVCLLSKGSEEGMEIRLTERVFALRVGQPVRFHLVSTSVDGDFKPGQLGAVEKEQFQPLPPMAVALQGEEKSEIQVQLAVTHTALGTLQIQCVAVDDDRRRWDVEFQLRNRSTITGGLAELPAQVTDAAELIKQVFGSKSKDINPKAVKGLRVELEKILGQPRPLWETPLLRELFNVLLECAKNRRRSENHERVWLNLIGFCLRPGFGFPLDDWRVEQLWKLYASGIQYVNSRQNWSEWWTLWRRLAGGLDEAAQAQLFKDMRKFLDPASARQASIHKQLQNRGYEDMVRLAGVLERLSVSSKQQVGQWLLKRLQKASEPQQTWWALGRIGARVPFYGTSENVIPPDVAVKWLQQIQQVDWKKNPQASFAATLIARISGDRVRDIDEHARKQVIEQLKRCKSPSTWIEMVEQFRQLDEQEAKQIFGEALPPGLKLIS